MPELPEVDTARRQLDRWLGGQEIVEVLAPDPAVVRHRWSTLPGDADPEALSRVLALRGAVGAGRRHGKRLGLPVGDAVLLVHLGMTGKWVAGDLSPPRFGRFALRTSHTVAWFCDSRRFGCVRIVGTADLDRELQDGHGPDALLHPLDGPGLSARMRTRRPIKVALLDQDRLAGLGNIHAAEALYRAGIHPSVPAGELTAAQYASLAAAITAQLTVAVADSAELDEMVYVNDGGDNPFAVYGREGQPCLRCGTLLVEEALGGRTTTHCPSCQPAPRAVVAEGTRAKAPRSGVRDKARGGR